MTWWTTWLVEVAALAGGSIALAAWRRTALLPLLVAALGGLGLALVTPRPPDGFGLLSLIAALVFGGWPAVAVGTAIAVRRSTPWAAAGLVAVAVGMLAVGVDAFVIEPHALEVRHVTLRSDDVSRPFTVGVVADLQTDTAGAYEAEVLDRLAELAPDVVLWPGDYVQAAPSALGRVRRELNALIRAHDAPPWGAVAVGGDVERGSDDWPTLFEGTGVLAPRGRTSLDLGELHVTALPLDASRDPTVRVDDVEGFHVVVGHAPDFALSPDVHADLLVAGHTHGGQVQIPGIGPILTFSDVPRDWAAGTFRRLASGAWLVVSRGVGMERGLAPRLRFRCPPELVIVHVVPGGRRV